ncbi:related to single-stranded DNA-binding protein MSSP-1 [Rhynchosporium secalis]|uniref:Related to single-stranded DNA-binding protein MSSP-1 n=1 Tax=Rhynchosporium secalis TaxID=38038 RepID=A0A1E1M8F3_RHYSE|nr:related to single-stranded DNA-binding protein MSSP-1 [Rhynchosporium secalis]
MSYQQTADSSVHSRPASNMYAPPQVRGPRDPRDPQTASYGLAAMPASQTENSAMNALMGQFGSFSMSGATMAGAAGLGASQLPVGGAQFYYNPVDNTFLAAPPMYSAQTLAANQPADGAYNSYTAPMSYYAQGAYPSYLPAMPYMPYTPNRVSAGYPELFKEVPGLENRRGSYSTNESAPGTPHYGSISQQGTQILAVDRSPFGSTPSPQQLPIQHAAQHAKPLPYKTIPINVDLDALLIQHPAIPPAVPAVFTPRESMRTLDQSLSNPIHGNRNVYIRGLHPDTDDETLAAYAARFGKVETSKAIIDTSTGACKGFGFAKYFSLRDSELCIRGFYKLGYEVGFARESFNSRLKAEGDEQSTNLYVSNLPKNMTESELGAIFMDYHVQSSRILRDNQNNSRGVGFARFENRDVCEEIIKKFHGQPIGEEGLLLQVRYADTPAQKDLKRITTERRQFRTNEYNVGAYGGPVEMLTLSPTMQSIPSPLTPRTGQIAAHFPSRVNGSWKRRDNSSLGSVNGFKDLDRNIKVSSVESASKDTKVTISTPTVSEDGTADDGVTVHNDSPAVAHGGSVSPSARKSS